jgi:hypothetical protein
MAQKNRANMLTDIVSNIYNNLINFITGQNAQDRFVNLLDSSPNILSDKDQTDGYVGTDSNNEMLSIYYNENDSRANIITKSVAGLLVANKFYQINDAVGGTIALQVCAENALILHNFAIDVQTGEIGTYDITTDVFSPIVSSAQTLAQTLILGNTSGANDIEFDATQGLLFSNAARVREGTINAGLGGAKGVALVCSLDYELKWEAGRLYVMDQTGSFIRQSLYNFSTAPTVTDDVTKGYMVGSLWTLDDGTVYVCSDATTGAAVWVKVANLVYIKDADDNVFFSGIEQTSTTLGSGCVRNTFHQDAGNGLGNDCDLNVFFNRAKTNILGNDAFSNTFKQNVTGFIFGNNLANVTIESEMIGANYTASPAYDFLYGNAYPSTIFTDGTDNYHRYYDPANDRIVVTNLSTLAVSYIGGGVASVSAGTNISVTGTATNPIINSLADRYKTSSVTSNTINNGSKTFTVDANLAYIPLQEVLIVYDPSNHMHATVTSYSGTTLVVNVKNHTGSGTYTSWVINLDGVPIDAISGVGTANQIAYFTSGQVIASLDTAIYPSLTELSRVKGVGSQVVGTTDTNTLTNKRITARTGTTTSNATPTINTDNVDYYSITALAAAITSFTTNLSGTPTIGQTLWISIKDNGTARAIAWGASFEASTIALPTTTVISTRLDVAFIWNEATSVWRCVGTC